MRHIYQIAQNTFREAMRDKILYVIVLFSVLMLIGGQGIGWVSVGEQLQIMQHLSLAVISVFGALICVFVGTGLIYKEIDKRTIYTVLSKPVYRSEFLLGKFGGLMAVMLVVVCLMVGVSCGFVAYAAAGTGGVDWSLYLQAALLVYFELMVVTSIAVLFSSVASPILSAVFTFCGYLIGQVTSSLLDLVENRFKLGQPVEAGEDAFIGTVSAVNWLLQPLSKLFYHILPDLSHFQLRNRVVYGPPADHGAYFLDGEVGQAILYGLCYSFCMLLLAVVCFDRKRF